ncbi:MAG: glutathione S-transferase [Deltaproteobacteria bacterium]|jgi:glutathione S-transferase|nr:glutathione S-transferase [Deltaproteobacteria bacterium]MBT4262998.1 glutathione S-transferase [Deltaproteobacteria bacterium]MBT4638945.1 glutathione S-transferase [Deltaproteobacteria bacterium]MBT6503623.1 glutathione S-transferase [Deltaproteobacteria bacterium]MBT6613654.1 glutathione S-transferase [Deltaproteobacteria bacterium]
MVKLHGHPISNYYNIVKLGLLEKGVEFEEVEIGTKKTEELLGKSPAGKIPFLETDQGILTETDVILEYIDAAFDGPSFFPADSFGKAKVRELMKHMELYVELPARRLYGAAFQGETISDQEKEEVKLLLEKGFSTVKALAKFEPYLVGKELTYADFYSQYSLALATRVTKVVYGWNSLNDMPEFKVLLKELGEREASKKVAEDQMKALSGGA